MNRQSIPTLGYPSQKAAIIALYEQQIEPKTIADMVVSTINVVHRAIHDYRIKTGRMIPPIRTGGQAQTLALSERDLFDSPYRRAVAAHRRATEGARKTLGEAQG